MRLKGEDGRAVALVGDGALTGGLSYEAMDDAGSEKIPLVIVLNDNEMSISRNVGGISVNFAAMRTGKLYNARVLLETDQDGRARFRLEYPQRGHKKHQEVAR